MNILSMISDDENLDNIIANILDGKIIIHKYFKCYEYLSSIDHFWNHTIYRIDCINI